MIGEMGLGANGSVLAFERPVCVSARRARALGVTFLRDVLYLSLSGVFALTVNVTAHPFPRSAWLGDFMSASSLEFGWRWGC